MFDLQDSLSPMMEINECRKTFPNHYIRVNAFDATRGWETLRLSFVVNRPSQEAGFRLERQEIEGRKLRYTTMHRPQGWCK
jgi:ribulose-bisphosphate carboxylase small chain